MSRWQPIWVKFMDDIGSPLPPGVPPLRTLYFYLTSGCNLACRHCWLAPSFHPGGTTGGHLPYELFRLAIDQAIPLGLQSVKLTGGEPLLHPEFMRLVDLLKDRKVRLTIETNGTLVTAELAQGLKERAVLSDISVSLDGSREEIHDPFRGVPGSFARTIAGIGALVAAGYRPQVIFSIHRGNVEDIESTVDLCVGLGAGSIKFNLIQDCGRGEQLADHGELLGIKRLLELGTWVERELQNRIPVPLHFSWPIAFHGLRRLSRGDHGACGIFTILGILPSGQLAMCGIGEIIPELCYGTLEGDRIADVWAHHPMLKGIRQSLPSRLQGVCGSCLLRGACLGGCVAQNFHRTRALMAPFWFCAEANAVGLFPSARLFGSIIGMEDGKDAGTG